MSLIKLEFEHSFLDQVQAQVDMFELELELSLIISLHNQAEVRQAKIGLAQLQLYLQQNIVQKVKFSGKTCYNHFP